MFSSWDFRRMTPEERFMAKVLPEPNTGCWLWIGNTTDQGYGIFWVKNKLVSATRWGYERFKGPLGELWALHKCDTPACVNPDHLFPGTHQDNMDDCKRKGRKAFNGIHRYPSRKRGAEPLACLAGRARMSHD